MYTIKEAALRAGVTVPLLRAWERSLGSRTRDLVGILVVTGHGRARGAGSQLMTHEHEHHHEHDHRPVGYAESIEAFRADKDDYFKNAGQGSPIPVAEREAFTGLPYYPVDQALRFEGLTLEPYFGGEPSSFQIPTSDGKLRPARRAGVLSFEIDGERYGLTGYTFEGDDGGGLFVPFLDATSGTETYGAGRYLDIEPEHDGTYTLDFNLAYHPSCVYDIRYSCPLTPAENRLPIRIEAGERLDPAAH